MTIISGTKVSTEESQGVIKFASAPRDTTGTVFRQTTGGIASITSGSAATAGGASALSAFGIAHGLGAAPTVFETVPNNAQAAAAALLGAYVTADATNVYYNTISSVTASAVYTFSWLAQP
jgi:hypothetical protein